MSVRFVLVGITIAASVAACGRSTRTGPLAALADSLLPADATQTCLDVPAEMDLERQGFRECLRNDRRVMLQVEANGRVRRVSQYWPSPPRSFKAIIADGLQRRYGVGTPVCDPQIRNGWRWEGEQYRIELSETAADGRLELERRLRLPHSFTSNCPDSSRGAA